MCNIRHIQSIILSLRFDSEKSYIIWFNSSTWRLRTFLKFPVHPAQKSIGLRKRGKFSFFYQPA